MNISKNGIKLIQREEGCILYAYDDLTGKRVNEGDSVVGTITIGTGHTSAAGAPKVYPGQVITQAQADAILLADLKKVEASVNNLVKVPLTQNQYDVLVSFQFNTGALGKSSALRYLNQGDYTQAAQSLTYYNKSKGRVLKGLVDRRAREKALFLTPDIKKASDTAKGVGGAVVVGAGTVAVSPANYWPWIIGAVIVAIVGWTLYTTIRDYRKHKELIINATKIK